MCSRGVFQLIKMKIVYSDIGGSSAGVRHMLKGPSLCEFAQSNPHIRFDICLRRIPHPHILCSYANGFSKSVQLINSTEEQSVKAIMDAYSCGGHTAYRHSIQRVISTNKSIQGSDERILNMIEVTNQPIPRQFPLQNPKFLPVRKKKNAGLKLARKNVAPHVLSDERLL